MKAVSTWSLHRTLGSYVAPDSLVRMSIPQGAGDGLPLLELPAELARHGFDTVQIVHFHLPSREPAYLDELRSALKSADVTLDALLVDDGDLTDATDAAGQEAWISDWVAVAEHLGARRARVIAGRSAPSPETLEAAATGLLRLARRHSSMRIVTENWLELLPDAASTQDLFARTGDEVGFLIDLGNWKGETKYDELAAVAARAETCHAKAHHSAADGLDAGDYRRTLSVLREAGFDGPLALVYDGSDTDEWRWLDAEHAIVGEIFPSAS
ncbi:sugar phosphate isomerase/epimerase family protein [Flindersiella endophytica]